MYVFQIFPQLLKDNLELQIKYLVLTRNVITENRRNHTFSPFDVLVSTFTFIEALKNTSLINYELAYYN